MASAQTTYHGRRKNEHRLVQKPKMNKQQYDELIGRHEHKEHQPLLQEVASQFATEMKYSSASRSSNNNSTNISSTNYQLNNIFKPPQPPPIPYGATKTRPFKKSMAWPPQNTIQKAVHMFQKSSFPSDTIIKYLEYIKYSRNEIDQALRVVSLLDQANNYWLKLRDKCPNYKNRYNDETRKYALSKASWELEIAMTISDFHLDHIVDIVYNKPIWSRDYDQIRNDINTAPMNITAVTSNISNISRFTNDTDTDTDSEYDTEDEYEEYEYEDDNNDGDDGDDGDDDNSEEETIFEMTNKVNSDNQQIVQTDLSINDLKKIQGSGQIKDQADLQNFMNSFFSSELQGANYTFADDFINEFDDDKNDQNDNDNNDNKTQSNDQTQTQTQTNNDDNGANNNNDKDKDPDYTMRLSLERLKFQFPSLQIDLIKQTYQQTKYNFDETVTQLKDISTSMDDFENELSQNK